MFADFVYLTLHLDAIAVVVLEVGVVFLVCVSLLVHWIGFLVVEL